MSHISDADYAHAQKVWKDMKVGNMGIYHDIYLKTDVLLLADVFETFRETCSRYYELDPAHFYTTPGLTWQACLKKTKANNKYMGDLYNPPDGSDMDIFERQEMAKTRPIVKTKMRYLRYWIMKHAPRTIRLKISKAYRAMKDKVMSLYEKSCWGPTTPKEGKQYTTKATKVGRKWVDDTVSDFTSELISQLAEEDGEEGYILEVDVSYPRELHDSHSDLPFMPERKEINGVEKLTPCLSDKTKYITHIRALAQSAWLKSYIDFNTRLRTESKNDFEKDFFKLMNNSFFGKAMENQRKHKDIRLATKKEQYEKLVMKPNFKGSTWFSETLMGVEMSKIKIKMNKPIYLGLAILDMSKMIMYEFHYDYMKPKYGDDVKLCYMDTDSFVYHIKTNDFYKDIADDVSARFDTSGYDKEDGK
ncbi:uncharacterized protein LOC130622378 [Hydractinia symbiolongicarpus]|uniref:uncharacterized protein LOC130622378 n=1 Tax=Hydractinia symbiolongicarpus TaxID=13093 RepID=UPI00254D58F3|nr:uncharacterized protein LOC130622378 [Hydractinia symbiolongicarpus]